MNISQCVGVNKMLGFLILTASTRKDVSLGLTMGSGFGVSMIDLSYHIVLLVQW